MTSEIGAADRDDWGVEQSYTNRSRRRLMAVIATVLVMTVSAGGLYLAQREGKLRTGGEAPLIQADQRAFKVRPEQPGGMTIPNQETMVYNPGRQAPAERLLPPPETPMARPVAPPTPPVPVAEEPAPAALAAEPRLVAPALPLEEGPTPAAPSVAAPAAAPVEPTVPAPVATAPAKPAPAAAAPMPAAASGHGYRLQIGALRSEEAARREWDRLKRIHGDLLGALGAVTARADLGERGTFFRIQAGPIADAGKAERLCSELKRRNVGCLLVKS
jgi:cell division septation protein DedD